MSASIYLLISGLCFALVHASVKFLPNIPAYELVFFRAMISTVLSYSILRWFGLSPWGKNKPLLILRGLFGTAALLLYFYTLQHMPLASAVTIQYLHPIFTVIIAGLLLRERPSWMQWGFFAISFSGVLIVRGFDSRISGFDVAAGVLSAFFSACAYNLIRVLRKEDHALVTVFYLPLVGVIVTAPYTLLHWVQPHGWDWLIIAVIGVFTQIAQYCMTRAYQADTAANISNLNYLGIVYALAIGATVFGEVLEPMAVVGMAVVIVSALLSTQVRRASGSL